MTSNGPGGQERHTMATEEEVKAYRYWPVLFGDGKGFWVQIHQCRETRRIWRYVHKFDGVKIFVDGVLLKKATSARIAEALNAQKPKILTVDDILKLTTKAKG
jgi:hypothetical protein